MRNLVFLLLCLSFFQPTMAQKAIVKDTVMTFRTYGYTDPDPVARPGKIYPYYRFDGYTSEGTDRDWKIIEMENDWIRVLIAPEIGGKIIGAIEKSTGNEFLYFNKVIKFRDVAMRGAWTSGGIEFNFGSIGHAPGTASPVNYLITENPDGSVSCFLGDMDLSSRTEWRVEVRLPADKAWVETHATWHNPTDLSTSKYHWMNAAADAASDLTYYWPGTHYIGHDGDPGHWPLLHDGRNISRYEENDYGTYHSYHVLGDIKDYFAGYYAGRDFGFGHLTDYAIKPGKKIWIWGLSRQGEIWVDLLTDPELGNGQYTEIQTGLLFNQAGETSSQTPYKHLDFKSHQVERFSEYWFPFLGTKGVSDINEYGVLSVSETGTSKTSSQLAGDSETRNGTSQIRFCALQPIRDSIHVQLGDSLWFTFYAELNPLQTISLSVNREDWKQIRPANPNILFSSSALSEDQTDSNSSLSDRPSVSPAFDWNSLQGKYLKALENARQRNYQTALEGFFSCLNDDENFIPALAGAAQELIRTMRYSEAEELLRRVLAIDTYHPEANYLYGIVKKLGGEYLRAREAFGICTRSMEYRSSAFLQLSELAILSGNYRQALQYSSSALDYNRFSIRALQMSVTANRLLNNQTEALHTIDVLLEMDPLNHQARFEYYLLSEDPEALNQFKKNIQNEFPEQTIIELALYYSNLNLKKESIRVLEECPDGTIRQYLLAYLSGTDQQADVPEGDDQLIFPYRHEVAQAILYAEQRSPNWLNRYYLGLIYWNFNRLSEARELFRSCGDEPGLSAFYLARARLFENMDTELVFHDIEMALKLEPDSWRAYKEIIRFYQTMNEHQKALDAARKAGRKFSSHTGLQVIQAKAELHNGHYSQCLDILNDLTILPSEGAQEGHDLYRQAHLLQAVQELKKNHSDKALKHIELAREWPEHLGSGKPYVSDERVENFLEGIIRMKNQEDDRASAAFRRISTYTDRHKPAFDSPYLFMAFALQFLGEEDKATHLLGSWMSQQPKNPVAHWAAAIYAGNPDKAERAISVYQDAGGGTPWNPVRGDTQFRLVSEIVSQISFR